MSLKRGFWVAVALQVVILVGMMGLHGYTLATGSPVVLKTVPVDPWDPFMGQYVTLRYEISSLKASQVVMTGTPYRRGQQVWVSLRKGHPYWSAVAVSARRPEAGPGEMIMRGTVESTWDERGQVWIRYGIEQFYVPEGEGQKLEQNQPELTVEALVDSFGRAALSRVFYKGEEIRWR